MKVSIKCTLKKTIFLMLSILITGPGSEKSVHANDHFTLDGDIVILIHGLARTDRSMSLLAQHLQGKGYIVHNISYPSTRFTIPYLTATYLAPVVASAQEKGKKIHFVTHSMGGILVRHYLSTHPEMISSRVVMIAPPNKGSEIVDILGDWPPVHYALGPAAQQLSTRADSLPNSLPALNCEVGVIAGTRSLNPLFSKLISGDDDGKVSVDSTKLAEMQDHLVLPLDHTFILRNPGVIAQVDHYLQFGTFKR